MDDELSKIAETCVKTGIFYQEFVRECRKKFIYQVLKSHKWNQCKAARELGMHRNTLSRTLAELGMHIRDLRAPRKRVQPATGNRATAAIAG